MRVKTRTSLLKTPAKKAGVFNSLRHITPALYSYRKASIGVSLEALYAG